MNIPAARSVGEVVMIGWGTPPAPSNDMIPVIAWETRSNPGRSLYGPFEPNAVFSQ